MCVTCHYRWLFASNSCCSLWKTWIKNSCMNHLLGFLPTVMKFGVSTAPIWATARKNIISPFETCSCLRLLYLLCLALAGTLWAPAEGREGTIPLAARASADVQPDDRRLMSALCHSLNTGLVDLDECQPGCNCATACIEYSLRKFSSLNVSHMRLLCIVKISLLCNHLPRSFIQEYFILTKWLQLHQFSSIWTGKSQHRR